MDSINYLIQQCVSQEVCVPDHLSWGWILFPGKYKGEYPVEEDREKHCFSCRHSTIFEEEAQHLTSKCLS